MGFIFSAFVWAYALFQVPGGWLSDRFGARGVLAGVVAYWSIMTAATAAAFSGASFIVIRFLFGIGEAGAFPGATRAMQLWYPRRERGLVQGVTHSASRARRRDRTADRGADHGRVRLALGVLHLRRRSGSCGRCGGRLSYRNLPEEHGLVNKAELEAHPRPRPERRDQSAADGKADQRPVGHPGRGRPTCGRSCSPISPTYIACGFS